MTSVGHVPLNVLSGLPDARRKHGTGWLVVNTGTGGHSREKQQEEQRERKTINTKQEEGSERLPITDHVLSTRHYLLCDAPTCCKQVGRSGLFGYISIM
jgi:hypothetical protein